MKMDKFKIAILMGVAIVFAVAYMDIMGLTFFTDLGADYTSGDFPLSYWIFFRNTALILMLVVPLSYYFFWRKDKSEAVAIFSTSYLLWMFGLADILYFVFQGKAIPELLPWLNNQPVISGASNLFGYPAVTGNSLMLSVFVGIIITYFVVKFLKEKI